MKNKAPAADLIGASEAQKILGIHRATLARWVASGDLAAVGRIGKNGPGGKGAFVFDRAQVEIVRKAKAQAKAS